MFAFRIMTDWCCCNRLPMKVQLVADLAHHDEFNVCLIDCGIFLSKNELFRYFEGVTKSALVAKTASLPGYPAFEVNQT